MSVKIFLYELMRFALIRVIQSDPKNHKKVSILPFYNALIINILQCIYS